MALSPVAQQKAQDELATVVGLSRLPTIDDIASLPYLQAVVFEVMRWLPVVPLGVPHRSLEDDEYDDYFIPAGTIMYGVCLSSLSPVSAYSRVFNRTSGSFSVACILFDALNVPQGDVA